MAKEHTWKSPGIDKGTPLQQDKSTNIQTKSHPSIKPLKTKGNKIHNVREKKQSADYKTSTHLHPMCPCSRNKLEKMCSSKTGEMQGQNEDMEKVVEESHIGQKHLQGGPSRIRDCHATACITPGVFLREISKKKSNRFECIQIDS